jgi:addiction module RelB/DinJ family antitoxin
MDSGIKAAFEELCSQFGMSVNTAMNVFANAVVKQRKIPFEIKAAPLPYTKGMEAFYALRAEAEKNGIQDMTLDEINEEIRLAREEIERKKKIAV